MCDHLLSLAQTFGDKRVLVLGDLMLDRYCWGTVSRVSPEAPIPVVRKDVESCALGGAANAAANVASLGGAPLLVGVIGDDREGDRLCAELEAAAIGSHHVVRDGNRATTVKTRIIAHGQHVARMDEETTEPISAQTASRVLSAMTTLLPQAHAVLLSDYAKGVLTENVVRSVIAEARKRSVPVIVDPKGSDYPRYDGCTVLTPNQLEATVAATRWSYSCEEIDEIGRLLLDHLDVTALLVTRGEHGMSLFEAGEEAVHIPSDAQDVYDVTGAGDTVVAALSLAIAAGATASVAARLANAAAGLAVEHTGTVAVEKAQLLRALTRVPPVLEQR